MAKPTVLYEDEFIHVINNESGELELIEGPTRFVLPPNKAVYGGNKKKKMILRENQYVTISNPFNKATNKNAYGERELRVGPKVFSLYPFESYSEVKSAEILNKNQAAVVKALRDFTKDSVARKAGELYMITGPTMFIPGQFEEVVRRVDAITISENEAVYIRNTTTSELKLVKGPISYMPGVDEERYYKKLSKDECQALGISDEAQFKAYSINVQKNECVCVKDYKSNKEYFVKGPDSHILGPYEGLKVISISAGVPKRENAAKLASVNLGPDFMIDSFQIRTKDNAVLSLEVTYKWRFLIDDASIFKLFEGDFIGYSCQSLRSRIREEASQHEFEKFHTDASQILRKKLFKAYDADGKTITETMFGRYFREFNFFIFELDVKKVTPVDKEIESLLDESIKASMKILCRKLNDTAETEAEKEKIDSESEIARLERNLIEIQNTNFSKEVLEKAKIEGAALIEAAKAEMEAEALLERSRMELEIKAMKEQMELLTGASGAKYVEFVKANQLGKNVSLVTVVPSGTNTLYLPSHNSY